MIEASRPPPDAAPIPAKVLTSWLRDTTELTINCDCDCEIPGLGILSVNVLRLRTISLLTASVPTVHCSWSSIWTVVLWNTLRSRGSHGVETVAVSLLVKLTTTMPVILPLMVSLTERSGSPFKTRARRIFQRELYPKSKDATITGATRKKLRSTGRPQLKTFV